MALLQFNQAELVQLDMEGMSQVRAAAFWGRFRPWDVFGGQIYPTGCVLGQICPTGHVWGGRICPMGHFFGVVLSNETYLGGRFVQQDVFWG